MPSAKNGMRNPPQKILLARQREAQALELKLRGATYDDIGRQLGISAVAAFQAYHRAMRRIPEPVAEQARKAMLERLERMRLKIWGRLANDKIPDIRLNFAVQTLLKLDQREARLLGLDAPQKLEVKTKEDPGQLEKRARHAEMLARLSIEDKRKLLELIGKGKQKPDESD